MNRTWTAWDVWTGLMAGVVFPTCLVYAIFTGTQVSPSPLPGPNPPAPVPAPSSALADSASTYHVGFPVEFKAIGARIRSGSIKTSQDVSDAMKAYSDPFASAIKSTVKSHTDASGTITDAAGLASEFDLVASKLGAK